MQDTTSHTPTLPTHQPTHKEGQEEGTSSDTQDGREMDGDTGSQGDIHTGSIACTLTSTNPLPAHPRPQVHKAPEPGHTLDGPNWGTPGIRAEALTQLTHHTFTPGHSDNPPVNMQMEQPTMDDKAAAQPSARDGQPGDCAPAGFTKATHTGTAMHDGTSTQVASSSSGGAPARSGVPLDQVVHSAPSTLA